MSKRCKTHLKEQNRQRDLNHVPSEQHSLGAFPRFKHGANTTCTFHFNLFTFFSTINSGTSKPGIYEGNYNVFPLGWVRNIKLRRGQASAIHFMPEFSEKITNNEYDPHTKWSMDKQVMVIKCFILGRTTG